MSDAEVLQYFDDSDDPVLGTTELADMIGFSQAGALNRLRDLESKGLVGHKKIGRVNVWWLSDAGHKLLGSEE